MGYLYIDLIEYKLSNIIKDVVVFEFKVGSFGFLSFFIICMVFISNYLFLWNNVSELVIL